MGRSKYPVIHRFPNGTTRQVEDLSSVNTEANVGNWNILVPIGRENNNDSPSSGERTGISPNHYCFGNNGVVGPRCGMKYSEWNCLESQTIESDSLVHEVIWSLVVSWVARDTCNPVWICGAHPVRLNTRKRPIAYQYREGKVKSTHSMGVK